MQYDWRIHMLIQAAMQKAGSGFALALKLGVTPEMIYDWRDCKASPPEGYLPLLRSIAAG